MNENRLSEITSVISMLDGPLVVFGYLLSLSHSDMYLFLNYVKNSKYSDVNLYDAIKLFSSDYLFEKEISKENLEMKKFGYIEGNFDNYFINSGFSCGYLGNYFDDDVDMKVGKYK